MALAITSQRLLILKLAKGGLSIKAKELLTDVPIGDVEDITIGGGKLSKPITVTVRGTIFTIETPRASNTDEFLAAYERARSSAAMC